LVGETITNVYGIPSGQTQLFDTWIERKIEPIVTYSIELK